MKNSVLITLIKAAGRKSSQGFYYDFALDIHINCLENPDWVKMDGIKYYLFSSEEDGNFGKLSSSSGLSIINENIRCFLQLPSGRLGEHESIVLNDFKKSGFDLLQLIAPALPVQVIKAFDKAEFGARMAMIPFELPSLNNVKPILQLQPNQQPSFPKKREFDYHCCYEAKKKAEIYKEKLKHDILFFKQLPKEKLINSRHSSNEAQMAYDQCFGLITYTHS